MKTLASITAAVLLGTATLAMAQVNLPKPGTPGMSPDSAVRLLATSDLMVDRQIKSWLRRYYPGWTADPHQFIEIGFERYAVVFINSQDQPGRRVYFRVQKHPMEDDQAPFP
jgi:hypothetical protein